MSDCPFYKVHVRHLQSRETTPDRQLHNHKTITIPWCSHKHSPVSQSLATSVVVGGANLLTCKGDIEKCLIPKTEFSDF